MLPQTLTEIANRYGTDKGTIGPSERWGAHNYTDVYEGLFQHFRYEVINVLEIGLGVTGPNWDAKIAHGRNEAGGASTRALAEYFPNAKVYGVDINEARFLDDDRITTAVVDQGDRDAWQKFIAAIGGPLFDVIIDDGSHRPDHQQLSLGFLFPYLRSGGIYVIEDLASNGLGDGDTGRHACGEVLSTRTIMKAFKQTGEFPEPNALVNQDDLRSGVSQVSFHAPEVQPRLGLKAALGFARRCFQNRLTIGATNYAGDSERMCVIRKMQ